MRSMTTTLSIVLLAALCGCGDGCSGIDESEITCINDAQCDDGLYCNGFEFCSPDDPFASRFGCVPGRTCSPGWTRSAEGVVSLRCEEDRIAGCFEDGGDRDMCCQGVCALDSDCDDRRFCNGVETCDPISESADSFGCVSSPEPCDPALCRETDDICEAVCEDADEDRYDSIECGGTDCNDDDVTISPAATEICDAEGVDEDCDATTLGPDLDGDGYVGLLCCNGDECGADCDDGDPSVSPASPEVCNGIDDNCDGDIDETVRRTFYADTDGDGFGDATESVVGCFDTIGSGYAPSAGDCDDTNPQIFPGAIVCDPQPNAPTHYLYCEADGTYSDGMCDPQTQACIMQPGGHGVCTRF